MQNYHFNLKPRSTKEARVMPIGEPGWRLEIPAGRSGNYRLAQLDDYSGLPRKNFPWHPPLKITLEARVSSQALPGTWGFGLWNDPFGVGLGQGTGLHLPTLPNCAWFFFASEPNHLSLRDNLSARGNLAAAYKSRNFPASLLAFGLPLLGLGLLPSTAKVLRRLLLRFIEQDAKLLELDPCQLHEYQIHWNSGRVSFFIDQSLVAEITSSPQGPLGLVIWIDNQYAAFPPDGVIRAGTLANSSPAWLEISLRQLSN